MDATILHYEFKTKNSIREFYTDKIKVFQILNSKRQPSNYYIIFKTNIDQKELNININQEVLNLLEDCNNWQISYWADYLGLNKINLICPPD